MHRDLSCSPSEVDAAIVGAGPAGLSAACVLAEGKYQILVLDIGLPAEGRDHRKAEDLGLGVGGCGLFSDGKFSLRPSATRLWQLDNQNDLARAEAWAYAQLKAVGFPTEVRALSHPLLDGQKRYPSVYLSLDARRELIHHLETSLMTPPTSGGRCESVSWDSESARFVCEVRVLGSKTRSAIAAKTLILATGRLGPISSKQLVPDDRYVFRRVELGIRVEHDSGIGPLARCADLDLKLIYSSPDNGVEWRTFCSCRDGEVVGIPYDGLSAYSGRADCLPTGRSNFGLNLRLLNETTAQLAWNALCTASQDIAISPPVPLDQALAARFDDLPVAQYFGPQAWGRLCDGLRRLCSQFPDLLVPRTLLYSPAIEGIGLYPDVDNSLRLTPYPLWVVGDATGIFRGNVAALVSGYYGGLAASAQLRETL